ncbi:hypothetical protein I316_01230 [Kwoniella heveanensis BCC8398]|uniref:Mediator of RNA polymerase II transcription subunit 31 n=1 Tax=Kwoniella heveanensis BCC8398 TaxID=1296120 RepID=A0A1B9H216_9TREE|nr:hypothetical protein I316_01230 [Kwoniella heveanensis BCC8398]
MQQLPTILPPPALPDGTDAPPRSAQKHANLVRFQSELEFVQCLAHPQYLHELSIQGYLAKPAFLNYLKYLEYWNEPAYVRFITYPTCLVYLTLIQTELFRSRLGDMGFIAELMRVGVKHHETWRVEEPPAAKAQPAVDATEHADQVHVDVDIDEEG